MEKYFINESGTKKVNPSGFRKNSKFLFFRKNLFVPSCTVNFHRKKKQNKNAVLLLENKLKFKS